MDCVMPTAPAFCRQAGFSETGQRRPLPADAALEIVELHRTLSA
jgi:hypothetical protein